VLGDHSQLFACDARERDRLVIVAVSDLHGSLAGQAAADEVVDDPVDLGEAGAATGLLVEGQAGGGVLGSVQLPAVSEVVGHWASWAMIWAYWSNDTGSSVLCT
jgi:hypothetical protein